MGYLSAAALLALYVPADRRLVRPVCSRSARPPTGCNRCWSACATQGTTRAARSWIKNALSEHRSRVIGTDDATSNMRHAFNEQQHRLERSIPSTMSHPALYRSFGRRGGVQRSHVFKDGKHEDLMVIEIQERDIGIYDAQKISYAVHTRLQPLTAQI